MTTFGKAIRSLWRLDPGVRFLNHGSYGATPLEVLAEQQRWRDRMEAQPVRFMASEYPAAVRTAARQAADFLGTSSERFAFVENATSGVNAILRSLRFEPGERIVTTSHVYGAVRQALRHVASTTGAEVIEADVPTPVVSPEAVFDAIDGCLNARTKLVVVDHIASPSALIFPVREIAALCAERRIHCLVDGAHAPGQIDLNVDEIDADWYVGNFHKWLCAPKGAGFLVAADSNLPPLHPPVISHFYGQGLTAEFDWIGTRDPSSWLSVPSALNFHKKLGGGDMRRRNHALVLEALRSVARELDVVPSGPDQMFGAMATFVLPRLVAPTFENAVRIHDLLLQQHAIEVPLIPFGDRLWMRLSVHAYNDVSDYAGLGVLLKDLLSEIVCT